MHLRGGRTYELPVTPVALKVKPRGRPRVRQQQQRPRVPGRPRGRPPKPQIQQQGMQVLEMDMPIRNRETETEISYVDGIECISRRNLAFETIATGEILVSGMLGLGVEIAKNLILAGVKSVTLHDEGSVELWDLSSNFVFTEDDVGKNRAIASIHKLQQLNTSVMLSTLTTQLTKQHLSNFQVVVFTDVSLDKAIEFSNYCHNHQPPISFIKSEVRGLFGSVFCDFGPAFTVLDVDGEEPHTGIVASISNGNPTLVACVDYERLEFHDGDLVVFSQVQGMTQLNDGKPRKIISAGPYSFTQVKQPKILNFKPLHEALKDPGDFLLSDFSKFDRPPILHLAFQGLDKFLSEFGRFPVAGLEEDAQKLISFVTNINDSSGDTKLQEIDQKLLRHFAFGARAVLNPMAAMFGGLVGQEVVKACSGKFHPFFQFFYFDSVESLPSETPDTADLKPLNSRYDAQISVFGSKLQKKMEKAKVFIVGSGALGCEFLKNLALMGVSCSEEGKLTITDIDDIEISNLGREFLFRDCNIGQAKSTVAATAATLINPRFHIEALQNRASPESEGVFDDTYWESLNVVINALDNVKARLYIDQKCLNFLKPQLESGTLGAKCNTQMVIPHLTEKYGAASRAPPKKQAPMHLFPYSIAEIDILKAKYIAGGIIPPIATTCTAMATGLVCLELYKVLDGGHKVEDYRNTFANLALPLFFMAEPVPPKVIKHQHMSWTVWDRWILRNNPTLRELLQWLEHKGLMPYNVSYGRCLLYNEHNAMHKQRMDKRLVDLVRDEAEAELPPYRCHFDLLVKCEDEEATDIDIPQISIYFRLFIDLVTCPKLCFDQRKF